MTLTGGYYLTFTLLRILAVQLIEAAWVTIHSTTLSGLQLGLLTAGAILISCVDLRSRPAQAASALGFRIISALVVRPYFKSVPWGREAGDWVPWLLRYRAGTLSPLSSSPPHSFAGSEASSTWSGKDVSSFRIPDRKLKARAAKHRGSRHHSQQRQQQSRPPWAHTPRTSGWESPSRVPASPTPLAQAGAGALTRSKTLPIAEPTTSPSPLSPRSPLHFTFSVGGPRHNTTSFHHQQRATGSADRLNRYSASFSTVEDSGLSTGTVFNPNARRSGTVIGGDLLLSPRSFRARTNSTAGNNANTTHQQQKPFSFSPPSSEGCRTPDLATAATWSDSATASLSSLTARVDALLRPYVPPAPSTLLRWPSSPASWSFRTFNNLTGSDGDGDGADEASDLGSDNNTTTRNSRNRNVHIVLPPVHHSPAGRRVSLDANHGCSSRHFTHGGIATLNPSRRPALERYAYAARMAAGTEKAAAFSAIPGRVRGASERISNSNIKNTGGGSSALASIGLDGDCPESIRNIIPDEYLLQLGALMGETACEAVLKEIDVPFACTEEESLSGAPDSGNNATTSTDNRGLSGWEECLKPMDSTHPGLRIRSWRLLMRKGLYAYKTVVEIDGVDPSDIRPFHLDDQARALWDDGALEVLRPTPAGCSRASRHAESCLHSYLSKFPGPLASRRYNYARRVWHRPADGGCYAIAQSCEIPTAAINAAAAVSSPLDLQAREKIRAVPVLEFTSAAVIRAVAGGSEISTFYFEDSQVRAGLAKVAVPKGLWPFWTKYEAALRLFADARAVAHGLPPNTTNDTPPLGSLETASGAHGSGGAAANAANVGRYPSSSIDAWNGGSFALDDTLNDDGGSDGEGSDDELYGALVQLKAARKRAADKRGGALGASTRWARRIVIAGALKMMHVMLATN